MRLETNCHLSWVLCFQIRKMRGLDWAPDSSRYGGREGKDGRLVRSLESDCLKPQLFPSMLCGLRPVTSFPLLQLPPLSIRNRNRTQPTGFFWGSNNLIFVQHLEQWGAHRKLQQISVLPGTLHLIEGCIYIVSVKQHESMGDQFHYHYFIEEETAQKC